MTKKSKKAGKPRDGVTKKRTKAGNTPKPEPVVTPEASAAAKAKPAREASARELKQWQQRALDTTIQYHVVDWEIGPSGEIYIRHPGHKQEMVQQLIEQGDDAVNEYLKSAEQTWRANKRILGNKRVINALQFLLTWAIEDDQARFDELLSPEDQIEILDNFCGIIFDAIKQLVIRKKRYEITIKACEFAKPYLIRFRDRHGIPYEKSFSTEQGKEIWAVIASKKRWKWLVEQHVKAGKERRAKKGGSKSIVQMRQMSHDALRSAVNAQWRKEFQK